MSPRPAAAMLAAALAAGCGTLRSAPVPEIYEGTSEIQRLVIAGHLLK